MSLYEMLTKETVTATKPDGTIVTGSFVYENEQLYLCFDGHKKEFHFFLAENTYKAALVSASVKMELFYQGVTEWPVAKNNYSY